MPKCYKCSNELRAEFDYGRQDSCPKCNFSTHVCMNCVHFDRSKYNECTEPVADRVVDKEKSNFCDYFKAGNPGDTTGASKADAARTAAEALFKKK